MVLSTMAHISGTDRSQLLLLPETVDDYVGPDNAVRFIDAFVDSLDLSAAGFERVAPKATGRPGYDPADLLKLYIYGYLNRVRSSRRLEAETHRNIEMLWLLRRLKPDFKTIADFRRDNRLAFRQVFRKSLTLLCTCCSAISLCLVSAVIAFMLILCSRNFLSHRHNTVINRHRQNALLTFEALVKASGSEEGKNIILTHAAGSIFAPQDTGYTKSGSDQSKATASVIDAVPKFISRTTSS